MKSTLTILILILVFPLAGLRCHAQEDFRVSDPRLEQRGNKILISYDILNSSPEDQFTISVEIRDSADMLIRANTLEGDIGKSIQGGSNKQITWDFLADRIVMNGDIYINISAVILPQEAAREEGSIPETGSKEYSRTGLILQSAALPGLGLARVTSKPHWIKGVAGYGCMAGAVIMNRMAVSSYGDFQLAQEVEAADALLKESARQDNLSDTFGYVALGIWVTDLVWTLLATSDLKKEGNHQVSGLSLSSGYDAISECPTVGLVYRF